MAVEGGEDADKAAVSHGRGASGAPAVPNAVIITSISTSSVTVSVTLSAGRYDGVLVELYTGTGGSAVKRSSGSSNVSVFSHSGGQKSFTVTSLTPALTPGEQYTVRVKSRSGSKSSDLGPVSAPATVAPAVPTAVSITSISTSSATVSVTLSAGRYDGVLVELYTGTGGSAVKRSSGSSNVSVFSHSGGQKSFTVTSLTPALTPGEQYTVRVKSRSGFKSSDLSPVSAPATVAPSAPILTRVEESSGTIVVTWTAGAGLVDKYEVSARPAQGSIITKTVDPPALTATVSQNLVKGQTYYVSVKAESNGASSPVSGTKELTLAPSIPSAVSITSISTSSVTVRVTLSAGRYDGVLVELYTGTGGSAVSSGSSPVSDFILTSGGQRSFTMTSLTSALTPGQQYSVRVKSRSGPVPSVLSPVSASARVTPATPTAVSITSISTSSVTVSVTLSAGRYDGVLVELYTGTGGSAVSSASSPVSDFTLTSGGQRSFTVTSLTSALTPGQQYTVRVKSRSGTKSSAFGLVSAPATVTPAVPTAVSFTSISTSSVTVSVTLSAGRYDGVLVELYTDTGGSAVSSGSSTVTDFTLNSEGQRSFTVTSLTTALIPGQQYTVRVKTRSWAKSSALSLFSTPATVKPSVPVFVKVVTSSGDQTMEVTWRKGPGIANRFYVMIDNTEGWSLEKTVDVIDKEEEYRDVFNPPQSGVYFLTLKSQSNSLNSSASQPYRVELPASPLNISVRSKTSRSLEVKWHNDDPNVENYRLVLKDETNRCIKEVHFTKVGYTPSNKITCQPVITEDFQGNQTDFLYNVTGLLPYIYYQMVIFLKSEGVPESDNNSATLNRRTETEVPSRINITSTTVDGPENVSVCWTQPEPFPGPTNYTVTVIGLEEVAVENKKQILGGLAITDLESPLFGQRYGIRMSDMTAIFDTISGYYQLCTSFGSLEQFWTYQINVHASTTAGVGPSTDAPPFRTLEAAPGKVTSFAISPLPNIYTEVSVSWKAPSPRDRNANITHFSLTYKESTEDAKEVSYTIYWSESRDLTYSQRVPVSPERTYNFTVSAESEYHHGEKTELTYFAEPGPPAVPTAVSITSISTSSVTVRVTLSAGRYDGVLVQLYTGGSAVSSGSSPVSGFTLTSEGQRDFDVSPLTSPLTPGQHYTVRVKSRSGSKSSTLGPFSAPGTFGTTSATHDPGSGTGNEGMIAMGVVIAVLVVILCVALAIYVIKRRRRQENATPDDLSMGNYETMKTMTAHADRTYESTNFDSMVIPAARVTMSTNKLNKGKPDVFRGRLVFEGGDQRDVAIRKIKGTRPFERCKAEVNVMRNIGTHPNIVSFLGYCLKDDDVALMIHGFEYNGDLQTFLRQKRRSGTNTGLTETNLLRFAENVSQGMAHLAKLDILHGDLRAQNVLISGDLTAKISGLQHARPVGMDSKPQSKMTVPPCRWAALETLEQGVYITQSEIWSFGVLMWEIMTRGATPYGDMKTKEIRNLLLQNCRLACPKSCQVKLYNVMLECWKDDPEDRPTFDLLSQRLASVAMDIQQYMNIGIYESLDFVYEDGR